MCHSSTVPLVETRLTQRNGGRGGRYVRNGTAGFRCSGYPADDTGGRGRSWRAEGKCLNEMAIELDSRRTENASCITAGGFKR
jgi:hypothetical protein